MKKFRNIAISLVVILTTVTVTVKWNGTTLTKGIYFVKNKAQNVIEFGSRLISTEPISGSIEIKTLDEEFIPESVVNQIAALETENQALRTQIDELNSKIGVAYQNSRADIQMPSKTSTTLKSLTLPAGTYIVCASYCFSESFSEVCSLEVFGGQISFVPTVRGTGMYGGGLSVSFVYKSTEETTLTMSAWQGSANTVIAQSIQFDAVRIK